MSKIEGYEFRLVKELHTALGTTELPVGDVYRVVSDPSQKLVKEADEPLIQIIHETNFDSENPAIPVVKRGEFLARSEKVFSGE